MEKQNYFNEIQLNSYAVSHAPFCIVYINTQGIITYANDTTYRFFGATPGSLIGLSILDIKSPQDMITIREAIKHLTPENNSFTNLSYYTLPEGQIKEIEWYSYGIFDADGILTNLVSYCYMEFLPKNKIIHDTHSTRNLDQQIRSNEIKELLSDILNSSPMPVMVKDVDDDFKYIYWNMESSIQSGIEASEALGKTDFEIYGPERGQYYRDIDQKLLASDEMSLQKEEEYITPNGVNHTSIVVKRIIKRRDEHRWLIVIRWDISDMKKTQHKLKESFEALQKTTGQLHTALQQAEEANRLRDLVLSNVNSGFIYLNPDFVVQWENTKGLLPIDNIQRYQQGAICYTTARGIQQPCPNCVAVEAMKTGKSCKHLYYENGIYIEVTASPVWHNSNKLDGIVLKIDNVTQTKLVESELIKAKEAAEESDLLKSAFLANMSHEIRTPLNSIVGFSELLVSTEDPEEKSEYLQIIQNNNELLLQLIGDILDLSKIESNSLEYVNTDVDINSLFENIEQSSKLRLTNSDVNLYFEEKLETCTLCIDKNRLTQIITNFINNAIKFTAHGYIRLGYKILENNEFYCYVTDTGCGILPEKQKAIFDRFVKLNTFIKGTGLGLSICKSIINHWGGNIGVESEYNTGSTFWFTLPAHMLRKSVNNIPQKAPILQKNLSLEKQYTILIAEDNSNNFMLLDIILNKKYKIIHAWNGEEAIEFNEKHQPDLILLDIKMPVLDGYETLKHIRKNDTKIPVIAITAHAFSSDEQKCINSGFNDFISKPINKLKILTMLDKWLP